MKNKVLILLGFTLIVGLIAGCKQYDNPPPYFEEIKDLSVSQRKVIVISIDGVTGDEIQNSSLPNIDELLTFSKYSYETLNTKSSAAGWVSMMTGTRYEKHHISDDSFEVDRIGNDEDHQDAKAYQNILDYVTEFKNVRTAFVTPWSSLRNYARMADFTPVVDNDLEVRDSTISILNTVQNLGTIFVNFKDAEKIGREHGYTSSNLDYEKTLLQSDQYIGEILTALRARENYEKEDWLIIITSNFAGDSDGGKSIFTMYCSDNFLHQELKAERIVAPRFYGYNNDGIDAMRSRNVNQLERESNYNIATTGEITIEAKVKTNKNADGNYSYSWPPFLSKVSARSGNTAGWSFFRSGNNISFFIADGDSKIEIGSNTAVGVDEVWTHFAGVVSTVDGIPTAKIYINGLLMNDGTASLDINKVLSSSPLTFGFQPEVFSSAYLDFYMADVHIWNTALTDTEIEENALRIGIPENHPKIEHLVGYWPLDRLDTEVNAFKNNVTDIFDMPVVGQANFNIFANNLPYVDPTKAVLNKNEDVMAQILYWLNIDVRDSWEIDGEIILDQFEIEFIKH